ncbi:MAG: hypothetical protein LC753_09470 [Acidobacteria bacterium]|nr:hypothetical protein [Acidobacteriota bacterium]MCA1650490.1 hypothetical protein [Acidobacteriota bacterium]
MKRSLAQSCCTTPSAIRFWAVTVAVIYGAGLLLRMIWPAVRPYGDTLILFALGSACFINFGRNRTLHCGITGPIFVFAAVVAALGEAAIWHVDFSALWGVVLVAVAIAFVVEWRTVGGRNNMSSA